MISSGDMLKIISEVYNAIVKQLPDGPPEIGGILGGKDNIISIYEIDVGKNRGKCCNYTPNVEYLNLVIDDWIKAGIEFYGIFHTHFYGVKSLSEGDIAYMKAIMKAMPKYVYKLFFPIFVLPEKAMILYAIEKNTDKIYKVPFKILD